LNGFGEVLGGDALGPVEISDGAGSFEDAIMGARAQAHATHRHFEHSLASFVQRAEASEQACGNAGIIESTAALDSTSGFHSQAHFGGRRSVIGAAQLFVCHRRNFYVKIDAIEQRSAHFAQVTLNDGAGAAAFARGI
jgi:hypothetical protein